jgi:hypothetical protein
MSKSSVSKHTPEVLKDVLKKRAKHIDALEVLQKDIDFLQDLQKTFGNNPTKEENVVLAKYLSVLDYKTEYLGQLLEKADMNFSKERSTFKHFNMIKDLYDITVIISEKVDKDQK